MKAAAARPATLSRAFRNPYEAINPHNPAVQFKTFYRTCSAVDVFLTASRVGLSTSDRILTSSDESPRPACSRRIRSAQMDDTYRLSDASHSHAPDLVDNAALVPYPVTTRPLACVASF